MQGFIKYKKFEKEIKIYVYSNIEEFGGLRNVLAEHFQNLCNSKKLNVGTLVIGKVATYLSELESIMETDNVLEVYATFVYRYVYRNNLKKEPKNVDEDKILYSLDNLELEQNHGYFTVKADAQSDFDKKYPTLD